MTTLHAPPPKIAMLYPSDDGRVYAPDPGDEPYPFDAARLVAQRVLACVSASSRDRAQEEADEADALVASWKALSHASHN
jgi:hypothetical protein